MCGGCSDLIPRNTRSATARSSARDVLKYEISTAEAGENVEVLDMLEWPLLLADD